MDQRQALALRVLGNLVFVLGSYSEEIFFAASQVEMYYFRRKRKRPQQCNALLGVEKHENKMDQHLHFTNGNVASMLYNKKAKLSIILLL